MTTDVRAELLTFAVAVAEAIKDARGGNGGGFAIPDFANYDPANKITANNGTWTADRSGFVRCGIHPTSQAHWISIKLNGVNAGTGLGSNAGNFIDVVFPVKAGDVIQLSGQTFGGTFNKNPFTENGEWVGCYFIPFRIVNAGVNGGDSEPRFQVFTANGMFTPIPGDYLATAVGGGAGGGSGAASAGTGTTGGGGGGGGGGAGAVIRAYFTITAPEDIPVIIGAGGAGGLGINSSPGTDGGNGGVTSLGTLLQAIGGYGGGRGVRAGSTANSAGGAGGYGGPAGNWAIGGGSGDANVQGGGGAGGGAPHLIMSAPGAAITTPTTHRTPGGVATGGGTHATGGNGGGGGGGVSYAQSSARGGGGGGGGSSGFGLGGTGGYETVSSGRTSGSPGTGYGCGGGGGSGRTGGSTTAGSNGGDGSPGILIIERLGESS